jgi:hypothetical protein
MAAIAVDVHPMPQETTSGGCVPEIDVVNPAAFSKIIIIVLALNDLVHRYGLRRLRGTGKINCGEEVPTIEEAVVHGAV